MLGAVDGNYSWIFRFIPHNLRQIVEVGSRNALDAISLSRYFGCPVLSFEADPRQFEGYQANVASSGADVTMRSEALTDSDGPMLFWQVQPELYANDGVSSLLEIDFTTRQASDVERFHTPIQRPITVQAARWDSLKIESPSLLVMDVEGAELRVLRGFGSDLKDVNYVALEVFPFPTHKGGCSFHQVDKYLQDIGFKFVASGLFGSSYLKLKIRITGFRIKSRLRNPLGRRRSTGFFDVLYRNVNAIQIRN